MAQIDGIHRHDGIGIVHLSVLPKDTPPWFLCGLNSQPLDYVHLHTQTHT